MKSLLFFGTQVVVLLIVSCARVTARDVQYIQAISNPHAQENSDVCRTGDECPLVGALNVANVLSTPIATQSDTFMGIVHKRFQGTEVVLCYKTFFSSIP